MTNTFTPHFFERINQRGIDWLAVQAALQFGDVHYAQNSKYYFLGKKAMQKLLKVYRPDNPEKWQGLVLVFDTRAGVFKTCFKNPGWLKKMRYKH